MAISLSNLQWIIVIQPLRSWRHTLPNPQISWKPTIDELCRPLPHPTLNPAPTNEYPHPLLEPPHPPAVASSTVIPYTIMWGSTTRTLPLACYRKESWPGRKADNWNWKPHRQSAERRLLRGRNNSRPLKNLTRRGLVSSNQEIIWHQRNGSGGSE